MMGGMGGFGGLTDWGWLGMGLGGIGTLLLLVVVFLALFLVFKRVTDRQAYSTAGQANRAEEILAERYARGEISEAELEEMRRVLRRNQ